jgi:hypothetical protein
VEGFVVADQRFGRDFVPVVELLLFLITRDAREDGVGDGRGRGATGEKKAFREEASDCERGFRRHR